MLSTQDKEGNTILHRLYQDIYEKLKDEVLIDYFVQDYFREITVPIFTKLTLEQKVAILSLKNKHDSIKHKTMLIYVINKLLGAKRRAWNRNTTLHHFFPGIYIKERYPDFECFHYEQPPKLCKPNKKKSSTGSWFSV